MKVTVYFHVAYIDRCCCCRRRHSCIECRECKGEQCGGKEQYVEIHVVQLVLRMWVCKARITTLLAVSLWPLRDGLAQDVEDGDDSTLEKQRGSLLIESDIAHCAGGEQRQF